MCKVGSTSDFFMRPSIRMMVYVVIIMLACPSVMVARGSCVDSASMLSCGTQSSSPSTTLTPIRGVCLGCCPLQVNTTSAAVCGTAAFVLNSSTISTRCLSNGGLGVCPESLSATTVSIASDVCLRTASCIAPCNALSSIGRLQCRLVKAEVNTSHCAWVYSNEPATAACLGAKSVMRGVCISNAGVRACSNHSSAVLCCPLSNPSRTKSHLTPSRSSTPTDLSATLPQSTSANVSSVSTSDSINSASRHVTTTAPTATTTATHYVTTRSLSPTGTRSASWSQSAGSRTRPSPSGASESFDRTETRLETDTLTLPSPTRLPSSTVSIRDTIVPMATITPLSVSSMVFAKNDVVLSVALARNASRWRQETIPFLDQAMTGTQAWNPFAFDAQKEVVFAGVVLVPNSSAAVLEVTLRRDQCLDVRGDETVYITVGTDYFEPRNSTVVYRDGPDDTKIVVGFTITENETHATRRRVGLAITIIVTVLLIISGLLGNPGISLLTFCEFQLINIIGRQSCSRGVIAAYFEDSYWVVTPTLKSAAFDTEELGSDFGVILVHMIVAVLFFAVVVVASRLRKRFRMLFPSLPLGVVYILFIGATNAAWRSAIHSKNPGPATGSMILWVCFILAVGATVWRIRSPRGLLFLRYHRGLFSWILRGTHSPLQLRGKYSLMIDLWHESFVQFASPLHLLHLSISSIVSAFSAGSTILCFPVLGFQLVWQSLVLLMTMFALPGRSPFHNTLLLLHSLMPLLIICAAMGSLDCLLAKHFYVSEIVTVLSLVGYFISAVLQVWMSQVERRYRSDVERELKDITAKHRRIVFFMDDAGVTDQRERLPPISKHFVAPKMVDPDWRSKRHQDMFSFPLMRKLDTDGDTWSSTQTGTTATSAAAKLRQPSNYQQNNGGGNPSPARWTTYQRADSAGDDSGDGSNMDEEDELHPQDPSGRDPLETSASGMGRRAEAAPGWVSTRYDPFASGSTLRPLASQLRLNPSTAPASAESQRRYTAVLGNDDAVWQPVPSRSPPRRPFSDAVVLPPPQYPIDTRHNDSWQNVNPQLVVVAPSPRTAAIPTVSNRLEYSSSSSSPVGANVQRESVRRCATCRRWIVEEEGCENCALA